MKLLLDTHALLWWFADDAALSRRAHAAISDGGNEVWVSAASVWEIAIKQRLGKLLFVLGADLERAVLAEPFSALAITLRHGQTAGALPGHHNDPFDRMLIAQAMLENCTLVSNDRAFEAYGVERLW